MNDGSSDGSLDILKQYAERDKRIVVVDKVNEGVSIARNAALDLAKGDYIMFVDSDDWLNAKTCEETYEKAIQHGADCVMFTYTKVFNGYQTESHYFETSHVFEGEDFRYNFYRRLIGPLNDELSRPHQLDLLVSAWGQLFASKLIVDKRFVDTKKIGTEDLLFQLEVLKDCEKLVYIDKPFYFYRRSEYGTLTTKYIKDKHLKFKHLYELIAEKVDIKKHPELASALKNRIAITCLGLGMNEICATDGLKSKSRRYKSLLNSSPYKGALDQLDIKAMPAHWKLFFWLCKKRLTFLTILILKCIEYLRTHKTPASTT